MKRIDNTLYKITGNSWSGYVLTVLLLMALPVAGCEKKEAPQTYPVLGKDPVYAATQGYDVGASLREWTTKGFQGATVVHVSAESSLRFFPEEKIEEARSGRTGATHEGLGSNEYLLAAARLGIVGKVYWVVPQGYWLDAGAGERTKEVLRTGETPFPDGEIAAMEMDGGCLVGRLQGVSIVICPPYAMPNITEPLILDIDAGFFPTYAREQGMTPLRAVKSFLDTMILRGYRVISAQVGEIPGARYPGPIHRHLGEEVVEAIANPAILQATPPELWAVRDGAANMLSGGEDEGVVEFIGKEGAGFSDDPALRSIGTIARARLGQYDAAMGEAVALCGEREVYCDLFLLLADESRERGEMERTDAFYRKLTELKPRWRIPLERYGDFLFAEGRSEAAAEQYRKAVDVEETLELRLRLGDAAYDLGKREEAVTEYARALGLYDERIGVPRNERNLRSAGRMAGLFEERGRAEEFMKTRNLEKRLAGGAP